MSGFQGLPTGVLKNENLELEYLVDAGPRIVGLSAFGGRNLLAEVKASVPTPYGEFLYRGGHRLWAAPEMMPLTYIPDNDGVSVEEMGGGVRLNEKPRAGTPIIRSIEIQLAQGQAIVTMKHNMQNISQQEIQIAAWALTMFRLGGTVILPQPVGNADPDGLQNNRILALWPYTRINDRRLILRDDFILIRADADPAPMKIGYFNPHGWMAYWVNGVLFRKHFEISLGAKYPDGGCNSESYCNDQFVELESLGSLVRLAPFKNVTLTETWELYRGLDVSFLSEEVRKIL